MTPRRRCLPSSGPSAFCVKFSDALVKAIFRADPALPGCSAETSVGLALSTAWPSLLGRWLHLDGAECRERGTRRLAKRQSRLRRPIHPRRRWRGGWRGRGIIRVGDTVAQHVCGDRGRDQCGNRFHNLHVSPPGGSVSVSDLIVVTMLKLPSVQAIRNGASSRAPALVQRRRQGLPGPGVAAPAGQRRLAVDYGDMFCERHVNCEDSRVRKWHR